MEEHDMSPIEVRGLPEGEPRDAMPIRDYTRSFHLDADMQHVLTVLASMGRKPIDACRAPEARAQPTLDMALRRILRDSHDEMGVGMEMHLIPGPTGEIRARVYAPQMPSATPRPVILYFHGGGFVLGDVDQFDATPRSLSLRTGAIVVSCHYRQAPEHRFPAAHEDAFAAWRWLADHAATLGGDASRMAIVGEDSGANLALNVALRARDEGIVQPRHIGLVTPMAAMLFDLPSHLEVATSFPVNAENLKWSARKLFRSRDDMRDPRMNLAGRSDLNGLPPVSIVLAEVDPLRSEGEALYDALRLSGTPVDKTLYHGVTNGFFGLYRVVNKAMFAQAELASRLTMALDA
jgi:acetyl esterase/lipase